MEKGNDKPKENNPRIEIIDAGLTEDEVVEMLSKGGCGRKKCGGHPHGSAPRSSSSEK